MEFVTKRASKLLGNCKPSNITKELKKLKHKDTALLEANNTTLRLQVELGMKDEEIRQLKVQAEGLDWIREVVGTLGDVLNKVHLFDNEAKGQLSM